MNVNFELTLYKTNVTGVSRMLLAIQINKSALATDTLQIVSPFKPVSQQQKKFTPQYYVGLQDEYTDEEELV